MIKIMLIVFIVLGGFGLMSRYAPQMVCVTLCDIAGFTVTGGLVAFLVLVSLGVKFVSSKH